MYRIVGEIGNFESALSLPINSKGQKGALKVIGLQYQYFLKGKFFTDFNKI
jgi:hypothetical protein